METNDTIRKLSEMTDEGAFERLATAILREAVPEYASLLHPGVNPAGKTVKSPVDGISFVPGAVPPHLITAHHTTSARDALEAKWLHDPATVKPRRAGAQPAAPAGDVLKTAALIADERKRTSLLHATLILTTNQEPPEDLVRDTQARGTASGLALDVWSVSRLAHFLDNNPSGQWLRQRFLGIDQQRLSKELLAQLSRDSLRIHGAGADKKFLVSRSLDCAIAEADDHQVAFVIAESGLGKSVACYKRLKKHIASGGFGLILPHQTIAAALAIEQAVDAALRQLHPQLTTQSAGLDALSCCSADRPLLLVVEDINKSGQAAFLTEKLAKWSISGGPAAPPEDRSAKSTDRNTWRLLCPVWPSVVASLKEDARKRVQELAVIGTAFAPLEGREAVQRRAKSSEIFLSDLEADSVSDALGHDPLLIALHEPGRRPNPARVVDDFVDGSVSRLAQDGGDYTPGDYRAALRVLARTLLAHRELNPRWQAVSGWLSSETDTLRALRRLVNFGEVISLSGGPAHETLAFRHDRVRDALFADAIAEMIRDDSFSDDLLAEPYFAEVIGAALLQESIPEAVIDRVRRTNPLALFHALRLFREPSTAIHSAILAAIESWLADPKTHAPAYGHLRWEALAALSQTESSKVIGLTRQFEDDTWTAWQARFRNGDVAGGIQLCLVAAPWVGAAWRDQQIEHAKIRFGAGLRKVIGEVLRRPDLEQAVRVGALRLAGYLADPQLAEAIETSWSLDSGKNAHLADYLWAAALCCGSDPKRFLGPICDAWAVLPSEKNDRGVVASPRDSLAADTVRFAFRRSVPVSGIGYFVQRAQSKDLRWPITYMLHGLDHPDAVEFVVRELADISRRLEGTKSFSPFSMTAPDEWHQNQEDHGRPMSRELRERLLALWQNTANDNHTRRHAFRFWMTTEGSEDIAILRAVDAADELADLALWERLRRNDQAAIGAMLVKLKGDDPAYWWQLGQYIWSDQLTGALEEELARRAGSITKEWGASYETDYSVYELIMRLPPKQAESLLLKHWDHVRFSPLFVQAALYVATPQLLERLQKTVESSPNPTKLFEHIGLHYGIQTQGRAGVTRTAQIKALVPYLDHMDEYAIYTFWHACNSRGWFDLRRKHFDGRVAKSYRRSPVDDTELMAAFDRMIEGGHLYWVDREIEQFLEAGGSLDQLMGVLGKWLAARKSFDALRLAARAMVHAGRRKDLAFLNTAVAPQEAADDLIADTQFAVKRRRLN
jgi:hypothetical protein